MSNMDRRDIGTRDICMFGLPKSGKTSIIKAIFQKMSPQHTMLLDPTERIDIVKVSISSFISFNILDVSGKYDIKTHLPTEATLFQNCKAMIYVIDIQSQPYDDTLNYFLNTIRVLSKMNPDMRYSVFIHKIDTESFQTEDRKTDCIRQINDLINEELEPFGLKNLTIDYHGTTIYEHSLYEKFSIVLQKVIPNVSFIITLLDSLITNCRMEKVYLFDVVSKTYLATDSSPIDMQNYAICSDMIDVYIDISCIYGEQKADDWVNDINSESIIKLADSTILYLKQVEK
eukprot:TRINITY_DN1492_c0_g1_i28.p2 TRINITY_DN1492_c0_g1~~TRINITY_DN1492_c0_g1_i28.p2  ORF type:complete len:287 (-),score=65.73 TRINITY_DN1492_c0_g1_i28:1009-1869(-)